MVAFVGGSAQSLVPNSLGVFPRQPIGLEERADVSVQFPGGAEGELVIVQAEDGGILDGEAVVVRKHLNADGALDFSFTSTREGGLYHITVRKGFEERRLQFFGSPKRP